jgi:hypothetical protein
MGNSYDDGGESDSKDCIPKDGSSSAIAASCHLMDYSGRKPRYALSSSFTTNSRPWRSIGMSNFSIASR